MHEDAIGSFDDLSDIYLDGATVEGFRASAELSDAEWAENEPDARDWMRKARRDQIKAFLSAAIADFKAEHGPQWSQEMRNKADAYHALLLEHFGPDRSMDQINRQDAADMKKLVQALPANRKTKPETRNQSLQDAIAVPGLPKMSVKTVNSYIDMFRRFWD